jgi:NitT/TauT family transport system ATP-binding protein
MPAAKASDLKLLLHAPTAAALARARRNAVNAHRARADLMIAIIANGDAVAAALDRPDAETDGLLVLCEVSLGRLGRLPPPGVRTVPVAALALAEWQADGWRYVRA